MTTTDTEIAVRTRTHTRRTSRDSAAALAEWYTNAARRAREIANDPNADPGTHERMAGMAKWYQYYADRYAEQVESEAQP